MLHELTSKSEQRKLLTLVLNFDDILFVYTFFCGVVRNNATHPGERQTCSLSRHSLTIMAVICQNRTPHERHSCKMWNNYCDNKPRRMNTNDSVWFDKWLYSQRHRRMNRCQQFTKFHPSFFLSVPFFDIFYVAITWTLSFAWRKKNLIKVYNCPMRMTVMSALIRCISMKSYFADQTSDPMSTFANDTEIVWIRRIASAQPLKPTHFKQLNIHIGSDSLIETLTNRKKSKSRKRYKFSGAFLQMNIIPILLSSQNASNPRLLFQRPRSRSNQNQ